MTAVRDASRELRRALLAALLLSVVAVWLVSLRLAASLTGPVRRQKNQTSPPKRPAATAGMTKPLTASIHSSGQKRSVTSGVSMSPAAIRQMMPV